MRHLKLARSWVALRLYRIYVTHILYGCIRWWKLEEAKPLLDRLLDLEWSPLAAWGLESLTQELNSLANRVEARDDLFGEDMAEELRWVAGHVTSLRQRWKEHLVLSI